MNTMLLHIKTRFSPQSGIPACSLETLPAKYWGKNAEPDAILQTMPKSMIFEVKDADDKPFEFELKPEMPT